MKLEINIRELARRALILLAGSAAAALILICLFTDIGTYTLFRIGVAMDAEEIDTADNAHLAYYDVKASLNDTDSYRIFLDESVNGSYEAALDFLKFLKQNTDVSLLCADMTDIDKINGYLESGDPNLLLDAGISGARNTFLQKLYLYNQMLPPKKRVTVTDDPSDGRCYILAFAPYERTAAEEGIVDISIVYPGTEACDPLFNAQSLTVDGCRIRFGVTDRLADYTDILAATSGNMGKPEFNGLNQPKYYFMIENGVDGEGGLLGGLIGTVNDIIERLEEED